MAFTADLNPKGGKSMDLLDLIKMEDYLERSGRKAKSTAKVNDMIKSSADDVGTPFRFNNSQNDNVG
jgi:hypothetical protein